MLEQITKAEWDAIHPDYKGVWTTEQTDWPNWAEVRDQYMGKRTLMRAQGADGGFIAGGSPGAAGSAARVAEKG